MQKRETYFFRYGKINIKFSDKNGSYLKQVLIDNETGLVKSVIIICN